MSTKTLARGSRGEQAERLLISLHKYHNDSRWRQHKEEAIMAETDGHVTYKEVLDLHIKNFIASGKPQAVKPEKESPVPAAKHKKNFSWKDGIKALFASNGNHPLTARAILNAVCKERKNKKTKKKLAHCLWTYCKADWLKKEGDKYSLKNFKHNV